MNNLNKGIEDISGGVLIHLVEKIISLSNKKITMSLMQYKDKP